MVFWCTINDEYCTKHTYTLYICTHNTHSKLSIVAKRHSHVVACSSNVVLGDVQAPSVRLQSKLTTQNKCRSNVVRSLSTDHYLAQYYASDGWVSSKLFISRDNPCRHWWWTESTADYSWISPFTRRLEGYLNSTLKFEQWTLQFFSHPATTSCPNSWDLYILWGYIIRERVAQLNQRLGSTEHEFLGQVAESYERAERQFIQYRRLLVTRQLTAQHRQLQVLRPCLQETGSNTMQS